MAIPITVMIDHSIELTMLSCKPLAQSVALVSSSVTLTITMGTRTHRRLRKQAMMVSISRTVAIQPRRLPSSSTSRNPSATMTGPPTSTAWLSCCRTSCFIRASVFSCSAAGMSGSNKQVTAAVRRSAPTL